VNKLARQVITALGLFCFVSEAPALAQNERGVGKGRQQDLATKNAVPLRPTGPVTGQYIIVFRNNVANPAVAANDIANAYGLGRGHLYRTVLKGFSATVPDAAIAGLSRDPRIAYIEADQWMHTNVVPTGIQRIGVPIGGANGETPWPGGGAVDVDVAVIDTGIATHDEITLEGHINCSGNWRLDTWTKCSDGGSDGNGHGTHVAGTIGGAYVGVAPGARMWGVKVLRDSGSGWNSNVIAGVEYVATLGVPVANMSLGGGNSAALCTAIEQAVAAGVTFAVAAGNENADASGSSPANCNDIANPDDGIITVSALADSDGVEGGGIWPPVACRSGETEDAMATFSNYGDVVDVIAPGVCIYSAWSDGGYRSISGTSMASPHVAGAAALYYAANIGNLSPGLSPGVVEGAIKAAGNINKWGEDKDGSKEPLIDVSGPGFAPLGYNAGDVDDPTIVTINSPSAGEVSGSVLINVSVSDDDAIVGLSIVVSNAGGETVKQWDCGDVNVCERNWETDNVVADGTYTITATATNNAQPPQSATSTVSVTVNNEPDPEPENLIPDTATVTYSANKKHLFIDISIEDRVGNIQGPVSGATVDVTVSSSTDGSGTASAITNSDGVASFVWRNAPSGTYTTGVDHVTTADGTGYEVVTKESNTGEFPQN
jgi:subtilisin family serine protease